VPFSSIHGAASHLPFGEVSHQEIKVLLHRTKLKACAVASAKVVGYGVMVGRLSTVGETVGIIEIVGVLCFITMGGVWIGSTFPHDIRNVERIVIARNFDKYLFMAIATQLVIRDPPGH